MKNSKKPVSSVKKSSLWRLLAQVVILGVAAYVLAPQIVQLSENRQLITGLSIYWLLLAQAVFLLSFLFAALVYRALGGSRLPVQRTLTVQLATAFTNRLLPSGIGGIGTNTLYLVRQGYKKAEALSYVTANNVIGFVAFMLFLLTTGALSVPALRQLFNGSSGTAGYVMMVSLAIAIIALIFKKIRQPIFNFIGRASLVFIGLARRPALLSSALLASIGIPLCYTLSLYCCLRAAGITLDLHQIVLVFGAGAIAVSASPTPGGLGAAEVAMVAAMTHFGIMNANALTCVLAFRVVSFWIPIIPGYIYFRICLKRRYV